MAERIIAFDQGTTSSRAVLFDLEGNLLDMAQQEFTQFFPRPGWVEHDPEEIWNSQRSVFRQLLERNRLSPHDVTAIGITNQRETTVVWDRRTGEPVMNAIVWQDKRTSALCERLKKEGHETMVRERTGLVIDSYFSATKIAWILENVPGARAKAERGELAAGTVDTWLIWKMTGGRVHATDYSNASRTMLFNIARLQWDDDLLKLFGVPASLLPEVHPSSWHYGDFVVDSVPVPVSGVVGDQQAALFGQACFSSGEVKNTYGTGCFMLMNTGRERRASSHGLLTTIAWGLGGEVHYALEGSVFIAGAAIQWLRDSLGLIDHASDTEYFARQAEGDEVYVVPAFAGLGAPYWDMYARGAIFGLTRDTGKAHIIKATLQSLAYQSKDLLDVMEKEAGTKLTVLRVDGGAVANNFLMQFQADILDLPVERPVITESTALGAAYMAGIERGIWQQEEILKNRKIDRTFRPHLPPEKREQLLAGWKKAVERTRGWLHE